MEYYNENGFDNRYIEMYKKQITELWKKHYMPTQVAINPPRGAIRMNPINPSAIRSMIGSIRIKKIGSSDIRG